MRDERNRPVENFAAPELAPAEVATAHAEYAGLVKQLREARSALGKAEAAIEDGRRQDVQALADQYRAGDAAPKLDTANERDARSAADACRVRAEALEQAVDEAGDAAGAAVDEAKPDWLEGLRATIAEAESTYAAALEQAREAALALGEARHIAGWLDRFDASRMARGAAPPGVARTLAYVPGRGWELRVKTAGVPGLEIVDEEIAAVLLLDAAARAVTPPTPAPTHGERRAARQTNAAAQREREKAERAAERAARREGAKG